MHGPAQPKPGKNLMAIFRTTNIDLYVCDVETPLREVLARINSAIPLYCQIVTDAEGKAVGTVTDGDIRRGLLRGLSLDAPARDCMYVDFKHGRADDPDGSTKTLFEKVRQVSFLPVLDGDRKPVEIIAPAPDEAAGIARAVVMAGGFGTRLGELTRNTPKPLVEVAGKPILEHVLQALEGAGINEIDITIHYRAEQIRGYIRERRNSATISLVEEKEPLGTAGAFSLLEDPPKKPTLVMNADVVTDVDFGALHKFFNDHDYDAVVCISPYSIDVPFGVVEFDEAGQFRGIHEKPKITRHIAAGVYYLAPKVFALVGMNERIDMPEVLERAHDLGMKIGVFPIHEYWIDLGRPTDIKSFNDDR